MDHWHLFVTKLSVAAEPRPGVVVRVSVRQWCRSTTPAFFRPWKLRNDFLLPVQIRVFQSSATFVFWSYYEYVHVTLLYYLCVIDSSMCVLGETEIKIYLATAGSHDSPN